MNRLDNGTYRRKIGLAAAVVGAVACLVYTLLMWRLVHTTPLPAKQLGAVGLLAPVSMFGFVAWWILHGDELEQRKSLIGLAAAAVTVTVFSEIGGFLVVAKVLPPTVGAALLQLVFPILLMTYLAVRLLVGWRYGSIVSDERSYPHPLHRVLLGAAGLFAIALTVVIAWSYFTNASDITNNIQLRLLAGITAVLALAGSFAAVRRRTRRGE